MGHDDAVPRQPRRERGEPLSEERVLNALFVRLVLGSGARSATFRLLGGSISLFLAGDAARAVINQAGWSTEELKDVLARLQIRNEIRWVAFEGWCRGGRPV